MFRYLLTDTYLRVRVGCKLSESFQSTNGTPQSDSLSLVLFVIYLEAALRTVKNKSPPRPATDTHLPSDIAYADDINFVSTCQQWLRQIESVAKQQLGKWHLKVNRDKTEHTNVVHKPDGIEEEWRSTRKLGSLLADEEEVACKKQFASAAFRACGVFGNDNI